MKMLTDDNYMAIMDITDNVHGVKTECQLWLLLLLMMVMMIIRR